MSASYPELTGLRRPAAFVDQPTQLAQPVAAPAPVGGPAPAAATAPPAGYEGRHRASKTEPRHTRHLIAPERRVSADWWPLRRRRPVDAVTAVIPVQHASTEGPSA